MSLEEMEWDFGFYVCGGCYVLKIYIVLKVDYVVWVIFWLVMDFECDMGLVNLKWWL